MSFSLDMDISYHEGGSLGLKRALPVKTSVISVLKGLNWKQNWL